MSNQKLRHELKHQINLMDYFVLRARLNVVAKRDAYSGSDGSYRIRSLYFDNPDDKALREKLDGVNNREKFRIRYYNADSSFIKLEKKSKVNGLCRKESVQISKEECERLLEGELAWMKQKENPLFLELYTKMYYQQLAPKTLVDYKREAFLYSPGNVRVTLDSDIRTGLSSKELFCQELATLSMGNNIVLEVKYDEFLPEIIRDIVQTGDRKAQAFSKYAICRAYQ